VDVSSGAWTARSLALALVLWLVASLLPSGPLPSTAAHADTPCRAGHVALTFDDGPSSTYTPRVLDVLAGRDVVATFFVVGSRVAPRRDLIRRMAAERHEVANHTYGHDRLTTLDDGAIRRTIDRTDLAIREAGVTPLRLVRPPYGATDSRVRGVVREAGYGHVTWSASPGDWKNPASTIRSLVLRDLRDGVIVLLHDGVDNSGETVRALPDVIDGARARGYCFATLDDAGRLVREDRSAWTFGDVPPSSPHAGAIAHLTDLRVVKGCGDGRYCPDAPTTRAQMASFLQRALALPPGPTDRFRDVAPSSVHAAAIGAVRAAGITLGCSADGRTYCPNDSIRRDQMASFLTRALDLPPGPADRFRDVPAASTHASTIGAVHEARITLGCSPDGRSYCPDARVDRAQMASFVARALDHRGS
jgi:peptidoglycan/xylan/chitin deacetylase (PgdA/CDA1 family)